jgi:hypothetical protein
MGKISRRFRGGDRENGTEGWTAEETEKKSQ